MLAKVYRQSVITKGNTGVVCCFRSSKYNKCLVLKQIKPLCHPAFAHAACNFINLKQLFKPLKCLKLYITNIYTILLVLIKRKKVVSRSGLFGSGSGSGRVWFGFGPKVDKNFGLNSGLTRAFCLRCTKN